MARGCYRSRLSLDSCCSPSVFFLFILHSPTRLVCSKNNSLHNSWTDMLAPCCPPMQSIAESRFARHSFCSIVIFCFLLMSLFSWAAATTYGQGRMLQGTNSTASTSHILWPSLISWKNGGGKESTSPLPRFVE